MTQRPRVRAAEVTTRARLTLRESRVMEALLAQELPDATGPASVRGPAVRRLCARGWIEPTQRVLGRDALGPIVVNGWQLTPAGHLAYCEWAAAQPTETPP